MYVVTDFPKIESESDSSRHTGAATNRNAKIYINNVCSKIDIKKCASPGNGKL